MPMLAEVVDAVIGIDTHRDSHEVEIADTTGSPILTTRIANDSTGFAHLLALIAEAVPGPRTLRCKVLRSSFHGGRAVPAVGWRYGMITSGLPR